MDKFFIYIAVILSVFIFIPLYRVVKGPTIYDRMLSSGSIATSSMVLILLIGFIFDRIDMFIDITMAYAVLNFIGVIAFAKYLGAILKKKQNNGN
jgi:multicomponent Na+:H+ antiporter subunit F